MVSNLNLMVKCDQTVLADEMGRVLDHLPTPAPPSAHKDAEMRARPRTTACHRRVHTVAPAHGQDIVVDPSGNAFSVRVHLARHLHMNERVATLEGLVAGKSCLERSDRAC